MARQDANHGEKNPLTSNDLTAKFRRPLQYNLIIHGIFTVQGHQIFVRH